MCHKESLLVCIVIGIPALLFDSERWALQKNLEERQNNSFAQTFRS
jgi:hypothetical protein